MSWVARIGGPSPLPREAGGCARLAGLLPRFRPTVNPGRARGGIPGPDVPRRRHPVGLGLSVRGLQAPLGHGDPACRTAHVVQDLGVATLASTIGSLVQPTRFDVRTPSIWAWTTSSFFIAIHLLSGFRPPGPGFPTISLSRRTVPGFRDSSLFRVSFPLLARRASPCRPGNSLVRVRACACFWGKSPCPTGPGRTQVPAPPAVHAGKIGAMEVGPLVDEPPAPGAVPWPGLDHSPPRRLLTNHFGNLAHATLLESLVFPHGRVLDPQSKSLRRPADKEGSNAQRDYGASQQGGLKCPARLRRFLTRRAQMPSATTALLNKGAQMPAIPSLSLMLGRYCRPRSGGCNPPWLPLDLFRPFRDL